MSPEPSWSGDYVQRSGSEASISALYRTWSPHRLRSGLRRWILGTEAVRGVAEASSIRPMNPPAAEVGREGCAKSALTMHANMIKLETRASYSTYAIHKTRSDDTRSVEANPLDDGVDRCSGIGAKTTLIFPPPLWLEHVARLYQSILAPVSLTTTAHLSMSSSTGRRTRPASWKRLRTLRRERIDHFLRRQQRATSSLIRLTISAGVPRARAARTTA